MTQTIKERSSAKLAIFILYGVNMKVNINDKNRSKISNKFKGWRD